MVGQPRGTQRYTTLVRADEDALTQAIIALASQYGRYGYRRIKSLLDEAGWNVGCDRVQHANEYANTAPEAKNVCEVVRDLLRLRSELAKMRPNFAGRSASVV